MKNPLLTLPEYDLDPLVLPSLMVDMKTFVWGPAAKQRGTIGVAPGPSVCLHGSQLRAGEENTKANRSSARDLTQLLYLSSGYCFTHSWLADRQISSLWAQIEYYLPLLRVLLVQFLTTTDVSNLEQTVNNSSCLHHTHGYLFSRLSVNSLLSTVPCIEISQWQFLVSILMQAHETWSLSKPSPWCTKLVDSFFF